MYQFKESTNDEIEKVITLIVSLIMIIIPVGYVLQDNDVFTGPVFELITPASIAVCLGGFLLIMLLVMYFKKSYNRDLKLLDLAVLGVCISLILSTLFARKPLVAVIGVLYTQEGSLVDIMFFVIFLSVSIIKSEKRRRTILYVFLGVGVLEGLIGILQACFQFDLVSNYPGYMDVYRAYGTTTNANPYGAFMLLFACVTSGMFIMERRNTVKIIYLVLTFFYLYSMSLSGTRSSMLGFVCMVPAAIILYNMYKKKNCESDIEKNRTDKIKNIIVYCTLCIIGIVGFIAFNPNLKDTIVRTINDLGSSFDNIASGRGVIWKDAFRTFCNHPFLGVGVSNYLYTNYVSTVVNGEWVPDIYIAYIAHNEILDIMASQGLVGLLTYLFLTITMAVNALRIFFNRTSKYDKSYIFGIILAMIAYFVSSMFDFRIIYVTPYVFVLYGLLLPRDEQKSIKQRKTK